MLRFVWSAKIGILQRKLEDAGLIRADESGFYYQTGLNCFEIATFLAKEFGFSSPSLKELKIKIKRGLDANREPSNAFFVVYKNNTITIGAPPRDHSREEYHVVFEIDGIEFNFGPKYLKTSCKVIMRIPLYKVS